MSSSGTAGTGGRIETVKVEGAERHQGSGDERMSGAQDAALSSSSQGLSVQRRLWTLGTRGVDSRLVVQWSRTKGEAQDLRSRVKSGLEQKEQWIVKDIYDRPGIVLIVLKPSQSRHLPRFPLCTLHRRS